MTRANLRDVRYLGDGCYCGHDGDQMWLFLSNGIEDDSFIALEPEAFLSLVAYGKNILGIRIPNGDADEQC